MSRVAVFLGLAILVLLQISPSAVAPKAAANHEDGHLLPINGLLKGVIEGVDGERSPPSQCSPEFPLSTAPAATRWREKAGTGGGNVIDIFSYQSSCAGADVTVTRNDFPPACAGSHACVPLSVGADFSLVTPIFVRMNPNLFGTGLLYEDGEAHTTRDITHELGHALGFDDYCNLAKPCFPPTFCPNGEPTLMDTKEDCLIGGQLPADPQPLDIDNYHYGYHADAVASFSGYSVVPHTVNFTWDGSDIHNERKYLINWRNNCTGVWQLLALVDKNLSIKALTGLQGGQQEFQILPLTYADPQHAPPFAGEARNVTVNVIASLAAPAGRGYRTPHQYLRELDHAGKT